MKPAAYVDEATNTVVILLITMHSSIREASVLSKVAPDLHLTYYGFSIIAISWNKISSEAFDIGFKNIIFVIKTLVILESELNFCSLAFHSMVQKIQNLAL